jgi:hypothetical protein
VKRREQVREDEQEEERRTLTASFRSRFSFKGLAERAGIEEI